MSRPGLRRAAALIACLGVAACRPTRTERLAGLSTSSESADGATGVLVGHDAGAAAVAPGTAPGSVEVEPQTPPATVKVAIRSTPRAAVQWGRKSLGTTPVVVERPRESGPMDLVLRARGYLAFHTRAFTFKNDSLTVEMIPIEKKETLLGARKAPPPAPDGGAVPDGGAP